MNGLTNYITERPWSDIVTTWVIVHCLMKLLWAIKIGYLTMELPNAPECSFAQG